MNYTNYTTTPLEKIITIGIIIILVITTIYISKKKKKSKNIIISTQQKIIQKDIKIDYYPYEKKMLLTKAEYAFYNILKQKCDQNNLLICPKVRMEDFLNVTDRKNTLKYRGYIRSRHIDFMICNSRLFLLAGIELDDNSHKDPDRIKTDKFKNKVFQTIKMPLFRVKMSEGLYENQIDNIIKSLLPESAAVPAAPADPQRHG